MTSGSFTSFVSSRMICFSNCPCASCMYCIVVLTHLSSSLLQKLIKRFSISNPFLMAFSFDEMSLTLFFLLFLQLGQWWWCFCLLRQKVLLLTSAITFRHETDLKIESVEEVLMPVKHKSKKEEWFHRPLFRYPRPRTAYHGVNWCRYKLFAVGVIYLGRNLQTANGNEDVHITLVKYIDPLHLSDFWCASNFVTPLMYLSEHNINIYYSFDL